MTHPVHHPESEELLAYASGSSPEWVSLVVACHLTYCPTCRDELELLEELGGTLLEMAPSSALNSAAFDAVELAARTALPSVPPVAARPKAADVPALPRPLQPYFKDETLRWRFLVPGVKQIPLTLSVGGIPARVVQFKPGFVVPDHTHQGLEMVLVLSGALSDSKTGDIFHAGDLSRREEGSEHAQHITKDEPCVCLVVSSGPVRPQSFMGRVLKKMAGV
ncbi:MAG TPA: ChrR family anti-sigma-E factor [Polyangiaceae bacterium]|nr:ChrR family anti-sigma-E factor [Polyangiaceae bacterium]